MRGKDPTYRQYFTAVGGLRWRCDICSHGPMSRKQVAYHEISSKHSSKVAATFFQHPESWKYVDNGKWLCQICKVDAMGVKKAVAHEKLCQRRDCNLQVQKRKRKKNRNLQVNEADNNNDGDDDNDDNTDAAFIESFLRCHDVDASHREKMRSFYKMPTDQKIQKIQEVIHDLRGVM